MLKKASIGLKLLPNILQAKFVKPTPIFCQWEVTYKCNMKCLFCVVKKHEQKWLPELTTEEALNTIDHLAGLGTKIINFSGGEPTLREDLPLLIERAKNLDMLVFFSTNASTLKYKAKSFVRADMIRISIDGTRELHDRLRRTPGAFDNAVEGIKLLLSYNIRPMINTAVTKETSFESLVELASLAKSLDVQIDFSLTVNALQTKENPKESDLDEEQSNLIPDTSRYLEMVWKLKKLFGNTVTNPSSYLKMIENGGLAKLGCKAMDVTIALKPNGAVSMPCGDFPFKVLRGNLREIYYGEDANETRKLRGKFWFCKNCNLRCYSQPSMLLNFRSSLSLALSYNSFNI